MAGEGYGDALTIVQRPVIVPPSRKRLVPVVDRFSAGVPVDRL